MEELHMNSLFIEMSNFEIKIKDILQKCEEYKNNVEIIKITRQDVPIINIDMINYCIKRVMIIICDMPKYLKMADEAILSGKIPDKYYYYDGETDMFIEYCVDMACACIERSKDPMIEIESRLLEISEYEYISIEDDEYNSTVSDGILVDDKIDTNYYIITKRHQTSQYID